MNEEILIIAEGDVKYGIPISVIEKYRLTGDDLEAANKMVENDSDVEGQGRKRDWRYNCLGQLIETHGRCTTNQ